MDECIIKGNGKQGNPVTWRQKCIDRFKLLPFPKDSVPKGLQVLSESSDLIWKRYYEYRCLCVDGEEASSNSDETSSIHTHSDTEDNCFDQNVDAAMLSSLQNSVKELAEELGCSWWTNHMSMSVQDTQEIDEVRTVTIQTVLFSPYVIPHAVVLEHRHHSSTPNSFSSEFYCYWHFNLLGFDGVGIESRLMNGVFFGDHVTKKLAELWPADFSFGEDDAFPQLYHADKEMEVLCSNRLKDPPDLGGKGVNLWMTIDNIDVSNFTPATIARIRQWILGTPISDSFLSDFDFIRLLFASYGCLNFDLNYYSRGNLGHHWKPNQGFGYHWQPTEAIRALLKAIGKADYVASTCWLEYQARLVGSALRPCDHFYQPYNELEARSEWGARVLEAIYRKELDPELVLKEGETVESLSKIPWIVWDRASGSTADEFGVNAGLMKMVTQMRLSLTRSSSR